MEITMPQLGETVTEGTITKWVKNIGDSVAVDETLFEVSTDKVDSEVPSPSAGVLTEILVQEGDVAQVGATLAIISEGSSSEPVSPPAQQAEPDVPEKPTPSISAPVAPVQTAPIETSMPTSPSQGETNAKGKLLSPIVRKLINDNGLDANNIVGTGVGNRITREDVNAALAASSAVSPPIEISTPAVSAPPVNTAPPAIANVVRSSGDVVIPFDNMRRRTAEHMLMSRATSPHAYISVEVDFENVERARKLHGKAFKEREGFSLTYLPFIVRALSEVLPEYPNVNASIDGDNLIVHNDFHVGIAVDLDHKGLLVPALRNADGKRLRLIAQEIRDLAVRARTKKLQPEEIMGSTFTITNPGPYGSQQTFAIINQPQVAILATDGIKKKPVVVQDEFGQDVIAIHHMGMLTLGWDHRAFDGGYTAAFLNRLREVLEERDWESEIV